MAEPTPVRNSMLLSPIRAAYVVMVADTSNLSLCQPVRSSVGGRRLPLPDGQATMRWREGQQCVEQRGQVTGPRGAKRHRVPLAAGNCLTQAVHHVPVRIANQAHSRSELLHLLTFSHRSAQTHQVVPECLFVRDAELLYVRVGAGPRCVRQFEPLPDQRSKQIVEAHASSI